MNKKCLILLSVLYCVIKYTNSQQCSTKTENCSTEHENKYSKDANEKYNKYLKLIETAKATYQKCDNKNCNCYLPVIQKDLKPFKNGISKEMLQDIKPKGTKYQIIKNKVYRDQNCMFPSRCAGIDYFLLQIAHKLPDMELVINCRDWPQINKHYGVFGPVFSFSKTSDYNDIMYPTWAFWEGGPAIGLYPRGIGRWDLHRLKLGKKANETLWEMKKPIGFFRGSRTSGERDPLILLSREFPELIDAQYTKNQAWKSIEDTLGAPPASEVSFEDHCNYKYLFNFRGVAASFRFKHILLCKSLVFHVGDEWQEFFYASLKPWIHYVPIETNASKDKIKDVLEFFENHDELAREIAENGFNIIWENLRMKDVSCYWSRLLKKYAKLLMFDVEKDDALIEIKKVD